MYFIPRSYGCTCVPEGSGTFSLSFLPSGDRIVLLVRFCTFACEWPGYEGVSSGLGLLRRQCAACYSVCVSSMFHFTALTRVWLPSSPRALFTHTCCCVSLSKFSAKQDAVSPCRFASPVPGAPALHLTFVSRAPTAWTARTQPRRPVVAACARRVLIRPKWGLRA